MKPRFRCVAFFFMIIFLASCAGQQIATGPPPPDALKNQFVKDSYKQLYAVAATYNAAWKTLLDLHKAGIVSDADFQYARTLARQYRSAHMDAVDILQKLETGGANQTQADVLVSLAITLNNQVMAYLQPKIRPPPGPAKTGP